MPWPAILGSIAAPLIGGLLGGSGGGGGTTTTTQNQAPWIGQQPFLLQLYKNAMGSPGRDVWTPDQSFGNRQGLDTAFPATRAPTSGRDLWMPGQGQGLDTPFGTPAGGGAGFGNDWNFDQILDINNYGGSYTSPEGSWSRGPGIGGLQLQQYYPGSTVVPQSQETLQALNLQAQRALSGSPLQSMGNQQLGGTLGGQYLGAQPGAGYLQGLTSRQDPYGYARQGYMGNPELQRTARGDYLTGGQGFNAAFDAARNRITPAVQGGFESAGRFGSGLAQEAETGALADAFAGLYGQERQRQFGAAGQLAGFNAQERARATQALLAQQAFAQQASGQLSSQAANMFGQERQRQLAGLGFIPQMAGMDFQNIAALSNVGRQREAFGAQQMADRVDRWNFGQQAPYNLLGAQSAVVQGGFPGGQTTTQTPYFQNRLAGALGGALTGASIYDMWGGFGGGGGGGQNTAQSAANWALYT